MQSFTNMGRLSNDERNMVIPMAIFLSSLLSRPILVNDCIYVFVCFYCVPVDWVSIGCFVILDWPVQWVCTCKICFCVRLYCSFQNKIMWKFQHYRQSKASWDLGFKLKLILHLSNLLIQRFKKCAFLNRLSVY